MFRTMRAEVTRRREVRDQEISRRPFSRIPEAPSGTRFDFGVRPPALKCEQEHSFLDLSTLDLIGNVDSYMGWTG